MRNQTKQHSLKVGLLAAAIALTLGATNGLAVPFSLEMIPTLGTDTVTGSRAITDDGRYVVGVSGSGTTARGYLYPVAAFGGSGVPVSVLSSDGAQATEADGVGYRTYAGNQEIIIAGKSSGYVTEFMTPDGGATFGVKRRNVSYTLNTMGSYNQLGSPGNTDAYYVTSRNTSQLLLHINQGSGAWPATITTSPKSVSTQARMQGIGATGAAVGSRVNGSLRSNYRMDYNGTASPYNAYFNGLNTVTPQQGEAWDVSDDGKYVTGFSGLGTATADSYAYKATFAGTVWQSTFQLPTTGLETGSTTKTVAYGISPDGSWIGGGSYQGIYHPMLWNVGDPNPANWTYLDLNAYATILGIKDGYTRLTRVFSVGLDPTGTQVVVTGEGTWSPDGGVTSYTRAFVMVIPEPSIAVLAGLGLCSLLVFRRRQ